VVHTPEQKVKKKVVKQLKDMGVYYFSPMTGGYGYSGVPDIVGCYKGIFFGIECKSDGSKTPTPLQQKNLEQIMEQGGLSVLIHGDNVDKVRIKTLLENFRIGKQ
tara:strand:- start:164 stop:478 length:315 start_codon:yes stop_codon:yes gene_type:complete